MVIILFTEPLVLVGAAVFIVFFTMLFPTLLVYFCILLLNDTMVSINHSNLKLSEAPMTTIGGVNLQHK